ncbi:MAG: flavodoxin domain-containing protein [Actinobacteria bacterium]|nr:flavodoxin domain-containing protein [Actinomycetota bacterium]
MKTSVLVAYATKKGSTREVAESIATTLAAQGLVVETRPAADVGDLSPYGGVVLGSSIYTGRLHADARYFLRRHRHELTHKRFAVFALGPRTLEREDVANSRKQVDHELEKMPELSPLSVAVFGGVLDPEQHHFPFNHMPKTDARDWNAIESWADAISSEISAPHVPDTLTGHRGEVTATVSM